MNLRASREVDVTVSEGASPGWVNVAFGACSLTQGGRVLSDVSLPPVGPPLRNGPVETRPSWLERVHDADL